MFWTDFAQNFIFSEIKILLYWVELVSELFKNLQVAKRCQGNENLLYNTFDTETYIKTIQGEVERYVNDFGLSHWQICCSVMEWEPTGIGCEDVIHAHG